MIRLNEILQPRWNSPLVRYFGMKVTGAPSPTLAPEIAPSFDINQMDDGALYYTRGERLASYGQTMAAGGAGNYSNFQIRNPATSGILVIVEAIQVSASAACIAGINTGTADLTNPAVGFVQDGRWRDSTGNLRSSAIPSYENSTAVAVNVNNNLYLPSGQTERRRVCFVVPPGYIFGIYNTTTNSSLVATAEWRERVLPFEERATG